MASATAHKQIVYCLVNVYVEYEVFKINHRLAPFLPCSIRVYKKKKPVGSLKVKSLKVKRKKESKGKEGKKEKKVYTILSLFTNYKSEQQIYRFVEYKIQLTRKITFQESYTRTYTNCCVSS